MIRSKFVMVGGVLPACLALAACGSAEFARSSDAGSYKQLMYNYKVSVVETLDELEPPLDVVGTFSATTHAEDDRKSVEGRFIAQARKSGCDAVAEVVAQPEDRKATRPVKVLGKDGRPETRQEEYTTRVYNWTGKCVRTSVVGVDPAVLVKRQNAGVAVPVAAVQPVTPTTPVLPQTEQPTVPLRPETPSIQAARELCQRLDKYSDGFLRAWKAKLRAAQPEPMDALDAWTELAYQVTGPAGFWRKTVPQQWFGCGADAKSDQCKKLRDASGREFKKWDQLQQTVSAVGPAQAGSFLRRNQPKLIEYLDAVVPESANLTGMESTMFYRDFLK